MLTGQLRGAAHLKRSKKDWDEEGQFLPRHSKSSPTQQGLAFTAQSILALGNQKYEIQHWSHPPSGADHDLLHRKDQAPFCRRPGLFLLRCIALAAVVVIHSIAGLNLRPLPADEAAMVLIFTASDGFAWD